MKIGIITNLFEPYERGGAERVVKRQVETLSQNHDVFLISTKPCNNWRDLQLQRTESTDSKLRQYRFYPLNLFYYLNDFCHCSAVRLLWQILDVFNLHAYYQIKKIIKIEKPDLVIMHNLKGIGYLTPLMFKKLQIKTILNLHDIQYANPSGLMFYGHENNFLSSGWPTKIYRAICRLFLRNINVVISPSKWLVNYYRQFNFFRSSTTVIIPNPTGKIEATKALTETKKDIDLLFVGQVEKHKGINWLINELSDKPNYSLMVVGQGSELAKLQEQTIAASHIHYAGLIKNDELIHYYRRAKFVVIPSFCYENSPIVIYEAYAAGTPVIGAKIGGIPELIIEGQSGFTFEPGNSENFFQVLGNALISTDYASLRSGVEKESTKYTSTEYSIKLNKIIRGELTRP